MDDQSCIFCKIINNEIPCFKIWENSDFIAILDLFPNTKGQTLVIPKAHLSSYQFDLSDKDYSNAMLAAKRVGKLLEQKLNVKRVAMIVEGMGVDHLHIKLYPLHGLTKTFEETWVKETVYFENYNGFLSTLLGPKASNSELEQLQNLITRT